MIEKVGKFSIVLERGCWVCNICRKGTYTQKISHKCNSAPHFLGTSEITRIDDLTLQERNKVKKFLKSLRKK